MAKSKRGPRRGLVHTTISITPAKVWVWLGLRLAAFAAIHTIIDASVPVRERPQAIMAYLMCAWMFLGRSMSHRLGAEVHVLALVERRLNRSSVSEKDGAAPGRPSSGRTQIKLTVLALAVLFWLHVYGHSFLVAQPVCWVNHLSGGELTLAMNAAKWALWLQIAIWMLTWIRRMRRSGGLPQQSDLGYPAHPVHGKHEHAPTLLRVLRKGYPDAPQPADA